MGDPANNSTSSIPTTNNNTAVVVSANTNTGNASGGGGGWWNWISSASESVIQVYKSELTDFKNQITEDTKKVTKEVVKEEGIKKVAEGLTNLFIRTNIEGSPERIRDANNDSSLLLNRKETLIKQLQENKSTYMKEVGDDELLEMQEWDKKFDLSAYTEAISGILASSEVVRNIHSSIVPEKLSYSTFWKRYFFKLEKLLEKEQKRAALLERADSLKEDEPGWDDEELDREIEARSKLNVTAEVLSPIQANTNASHSASQTNDEDSVDDWGNDDEQDKKLRKEPNVNIAKKIESNIATVSTSTSQKSSVNTVKQPEIASPITQKTSTKEGPAEVNSPNIKLSMTPLTLSSPTATPTHLQHTQTQQPVLPTASQPTRSPQQSQAAQSPTVAQTTITSPAITQNPTVQHINLTAEASTKKTNVATVNTNALENWDSWE